MPTEMLYNKINLMVPTRKRVENGKLPKFIQSVMGTVSDFKNIAFTFLADEDDTDTIFFLSDKGNDLIKCDYDLLVNSIQKTPHLGKFFNKLYKESRFNSPNILVTMLGDDFVFKTTDWDLIVLKTINEMNGIGIVYCRDGIQNEKLATNIFTTRKWVNMIGGEFMCEDLGADFIDVIHHKIASAYNNIRYLDNVFIKHEHSSQVESKDWDETFKRLRFEYSKINFSILEKCINNYIENRLTTLKENLFNAN